LLLDNKNAVTYGAGGSIGGAVAREYAREGARVLLAGRTREKVEAVAEDIRSAGGSAKVAALDALDALYVEAVEEHARAVVSEAGGIDVSFNLVHLARGRAGATVDRAGDRQSLASRGQRTPHQLHHPAGGGAPHGRAGIRRHPRVGFRFRQKKPY
jgi:NADP-dependent 3-hydroxy acid dehydrogenase YdfG